MRSFIFCLSLLLLYQCAPSSQEQSSQATTNVPTASKSNNQDRHVVIFDTDANNELDDQHALAYLLFNGNHFTVKGVTVNATRSGGFIPKHMDEAKRVLQLCQLDGKIPLLRGANLNFDDIRGSLNRPEFDGSEAVNFIIEEAMKPRDKKLILLAVGKLTNIALALIKEPAITDKVRVVWLGANYPQPGEYNLENDIPSMNYVLSTEVPFEIVTVRYGEPSGTDAIKVDQYYINQMMPGRGPRIATPVKGRHEGEFYTFGDYSIDLFKYIYYSDRDLLERALYDLAAVAILKEPTWGSVRSHPCPIYKDEVWVEQPDNERSILIWENFNRDAIVNDLFHSLDGPVLATTEE